MNRVLAEQLVASLSRELGLHGMVVEPNMETVLTTTVEHLDAPSPRYRRIGETIDTPQNEKVSLPFPMMMQDSSIVVEKLSSVLTQLKCEHYWIDSQLVAMDSRIHLDKCRDCLALSLGESILVRVVDEDTWTYLKQALLSFADTFAAPSKG